MIFIVIVFVVKGALVIYRVILSFKNISQYFCFSVCFIT